MISDEQRDVERVDVRGHADVPGDRREPEAERRRAREQRRRAEAAEHEHGQPGGERGEEAADSSVIRNAGSPNGARTRLASQPRRTNAGNPVGCIVPSSGGTVWASAVSQAPMPGSIVAR